MSKMARYLLMLVVCLAVVLSQVGAGPPALPRRPPSCCPPLWSQLENRCYRYVGKCLTWHNAQTYCKNLNHRANLVSLNTKGEANFIHHLFLENAGGSFEQYWTGLNDLNYEGRYVWEGINRPLTYSNWRYDQPNNYNHKQDCAEVFTLSGYWNDDECNKKQPFICELVRPGVF